MLAIIIKKPPVQNQTYPKHMIRQLQFEGRSAFSLFHLLVKRGDPPRVHISLTARAAYECADIRIGSQEAGRDQGRSERDWAYAWRIIPGWPPEDIEAALGGRDAAETLARTPQAPSGEMFCGIGDRRAIDLAAGE